MTGYVNSGDKMKEPTTWQLERWMDKGGCKALDGCWVEIDGTCPHGYPSWAIELGLV